MDNQNYSHGDWKKWLWLYLVIGLLVYAGIYLYYRNNSTSDNPADATTNSLY